MLRIHMRICVRKECGIAMGTHDDEVALKNTPIDVTSSALASRQPSWCRSPYRRACQRMVKSVSGSYCWNAKTDPQARSHTLHTTQNQYKLFCDGVLGPDYLCHTCTQRVGLYSVTYFHNVSAANPFFDVFPRFSVSNPNEQKGTPNSSAETWFRIWQY